MTICPFISHLLGEGNSRTLALGGRVSDGHASGANEDVVILGYDNDDARTAVQTQVMTEAGTKPDAAGHLHCLRESCRFFEKLSSECRFDVIHAKLDALETAKGGSNERDIARDIDKIWKFQTQGVTEIVESLADNEKKQSETIDGLKREFAEKLDEIAGAVNRTPLESVQGEFRALRDKIEGREEGFESLSTTVSDFVTSLEENFKGNGQSLSAWKDELAGKIGEIAARQVAWEKRFEEFVEQQKRISDYLEAGTKHREEEQDTRKKKESRKYNNLGVTSFHNGAYEMARDQFLQAVKFDPELAEAYNNLGLTHTELNDEEKATEAFKKAVELNPSLHAAYNNLGYIMYKRGNYEQAIEMYNEALGRSTRNGPAYTNLGNAYYKLGRIDDARAAWTKALELDPGNEKAKRNLKRLEEDGK
jgi:tetratricopeptide (TPR) repeat protein